MNKSIKFRLIVMNFIQWAVWGAYLTSMGNFLAKAGLAEKIGLFYAMQGIVSIFMPAIMGSVADRKIPAQKLLGMCHGLAGLFMIGAAVYAMTAGTTVAFAPLFALYAFSVAFYMPTIALSNSVAFKILEKSGYDTVKDFPPIRVFGTIGFIASMWTVNFIKIGGIQMQHSYWQFMLSGVLGLIMFAYCFSLPECAPENRGKKATLSDIFGLEAFKLFKNKQMAIFFIFSMLLGISLQITNGFAGPYISHFSSLPEFVDSWGANNPNALISISQISETLGILLIPVAMKLFGIKNVMLISMIAWVFRFGLLGAGDTGSGIWMFILSMIVYGVAFDFFNISGALYVDTRTSEKYQSSAQGLFMLMTNGIGATVGTLSAQAVMNHFVYNPIAAIDTAAKAGLETATMLQPDWSTPWYIFAGFALVVAILFAIFFKKPQAHEAKIM